jgi:RNA polymerase sigma factor (sigma-70 family)
MSGDGRDEPVGGGGADGGMGAGGPAARQVPSQGGRMGSGGPVGPPGVPGTGGAARGAGSAAQEPMVPGPAAEPDPALLSESDPNVPQQRAGRGGSGATAPLPAVPSPAHQPSPGGGGPAGAGTESELPLADADLVLRTRGGDDGAYEELFRRHAPAVRRYARTCCRDAHTADDLTAEVFARTLQAVRRGSGPEHAVRAYLLTTVRRVAASWTQSAKREHLVEDFAVFAAQAAASSAVSKDDTLDLGADVRAMHEAEQSLAMQAFRSLPERWQAVLWHTTVEDESPSQVAPLFGLTANATAVLAGRAREGLKQAYLQAHVSTALTSGGDCARYADRLGAYARGGLRMRAERGLRKHLEECAKCRLAAGELAMVNSEIPVVIPIAVVGWFAAGFSLKAAGLVGGAAIGAAGAGAGAAAAAGGSSAGASGGGAAAAEGASTPLKIGAVALAAVAAAAGLVWALTGSGSTPPRHDARPPVAQPLVPQIPVPTPSASEPKPPPPPPVPAVKVPAPPRSTPSPSHPPVHKAVVKSTPRATPTPVRSAPRQTPTPPPPPPPPQVYEVSALRFGFPGHGTEPQLRIGSVGSLRQRHALSVDGTHYADGASMHAPGSATIDLNRSCSTYQAVVGIDDATPGIASRLGSLRFSVYGDGALLWSSPALRRGQPAVQVGVDIAGKRTIRLVVQPQSPFGVAATADWAQARITCG